VDLNIDESSFTGETEPSVKHIDLIPQDNSKNINKRKNIAFLGTLVKKGHGKVIFFFNTSFLVLFRFFYLNGKILHLLKRVSLFVPAKTQNLVKYLK
jgi:hypothetical protein